MLPYLLQHVGFRLRRPPPLRTQLGWAEASWRLPSIGPLRCRVNRSLLVTGRSSGLSRFPSMPA
eukprot:11047126-Alexandrium_andersonii.AAC.1